MGPVLQQQKCVFRCSWMAHVIRSKSRTAVKFLLSSFLSVIIASQLTNYRSVVVVFSSSHSTGEACVCLAGCHSLTGSASQVHITPPGTTKHTGSEAGTVHFLNVMPRKFHKKEDTFFASLRTTGPCTRKTECPCLWNPLGKVCHSKLFVDDIFRGLQMIW